MNMKKPRIEDSIQTAEAVNTALKNTSATIEEMNALFTSRVSDLHMKSMEIAQINMNAAFGFARKLLAVKAPVELFAVQQDFAREQMETFARQASEMNELAVKLAKDAVKPVHDGMVKSFGDFSRAFAA